jgi:hypothetical protein
MINIREIRPFAHFARPARPGAVAREAGAGYRPPAARRLVS